MQGIETEIHELHYLLSMPDIMSEFTVTTQIAQRYQQLGLAEESYYLALETLEKIEVTYRIQQLYEEHYVTLLFLLINLEMAEKN